MKAINVTELKTHLSKYLRQASRGTRILVKDREEAVAELGPPHVDAVSWRDRLIHEGRLRRGTQAWETLTISALGRRVDIQASLRAVRDDPDEVRRR